MYMAKPDNPLRPQGTSLNVLNSLVDLFVLNLLWAVCCIPVVTIGASTAALYDAVFYSIRGGNRGTYARFFETFRREWKSGILPTVIWGGTLVLAWYLTTVLGQAAQVSAQAKIAYIAWSLTCFLLIGGAVWLAPLLSRPHGNLGALLSGCIKKTTSHPVVTFGIGILTSFVMSLSITFIVPMVLLPSVLVMILTYAMEPTFLADGEAPTRLV